MTMRKIPQASRSGEWKAAGFWNLWSRQSLTVKLVLAVSFVVCLIVGVGTVAAIRIAKKGIAETSITTALYQTQLLKGKLIEAMLNEDRPHEELKSLLENERLPLRLGEVNIFAPDGETRFSSAAGNIGKRVEFSVDGMDRVTSDDALIEFSDLSESGSLRIVHPIRGGAQCATCHHNARGDLVGGIELFVPLAPIYKRFAANRFFFVFTALAIIVPAALLIRWLVHRIVKRPITKLIRVMEKAEGGELDVRTRIREDPDLHRLAQSFNSMVRGIEAAQRRLERQYQRELAQSNRLASLGQVISNVSHEIRNPLAAIRSALHALRGEFTSGAGEEIFHELTLQIDRIGQTVGNLLRYARQAPPRFERCMIIEPIHQALHLAEHQLLRNKIRIQVDCQAKETTVLGDAGQLEQVFLNLFLNAATAMPAGGVLTIRILLGELPRRDRLQDPEAGTACLVEVEDTGSGIREEDLAKIFAPFFTTRQGGTGLGLSVVKGIIEAHSGTIRATSIFGKGTKLAILLPLLRGLGSRTFDVLPVDASA